MGIMGDMLRKVLNTGISLHRGLFGKLGGESLAATSEKNDSIFGFLSWTQMSLRF